MYAELHRAAGQLKPSVSQMIPSQTPIASHGASEFSVCSAGYWSCFGLIFPCYALSFPFGMDMFILYHTVLKICTWYFRYYGSYLTKRL